MENLFIKGSTDIYFVPTVDFNKDTGLCELIGESYLEETEKFYLPLLEWLKSYTKHIAKKLTFNIKLTYYNTNSSRSILDMLDILKMYEEQGGKVTVNWFCEKEEKPFVEEEVEDYMIQSEIDINLITYEEAGIKQPKPEK